MAQSVELMPLACVRCGTPVRAQPDELAWVCEQCQQGLLLSEEQGLLPIAAHFADGIAVGSKGRPFWVAEGKLDLRSRESYEQISLLGFGSQGPQARQFWDAPHTFFIPAFTCDLAMLVDLSKQLLREPPRLQPGQPAPLMPVTLSPEDVLPLAEFVAVKIEAERKDRMKEIHFQLQLQPPTLWILP